MGWLWLFIAIFFEFAGTLAMKYSAGFSNLLPSIVMFACYAVSFTCLNFSLAYLKVSLVYAMWSGVGIILITLAGTLLFKEQITLAGVFWIVVIVAGVVGLNFSQSAHG
ncbi:MULTISPECIES: DMT family transporter [Paenibacillus]|uniref:QacE family quaternary ammonium compound efflux SMR transporter n=1 Tax=Paenibacillus campinasensis TaxID=66347 RepID=A0A268EX79_9BACL|nr:MULTISPECIES: multidrug efflux SMR transporter [Paenibacillus]MUG68288.1 QacE family quaternary ammonium compound efflux SMR transporter [Paenibacillus campinasensis]PAD77731.1 hypothetical protein CHH67_08805 [Paenibacillus campinasensis]PAK48049.1 hypothetical protein CHH75_23400 [Paenibacillus sp. 7541]